MADSEISLQNINPNRPELFSRSPGSDAKNQGYYKLIEIKLCMNHYNHKSMPDAKFESGSFLVLEL